MPHPEGVLQTLESYIARGLPAWLSLHAGNLGEDGDVAAALLDVCKIANIPNGMIRVSTARELRSRGFLLVHAPGVNGSAENHFHVIFPAAPKLSDAQRFVGAFDPPVRNPLKVG